MSRSNPVVTPASFTNFGELLRYLRRRAYLTQRDLGIATGYSEAQISRLEQNHRLPDPTALLALFVPALDLNQQPDWTTRLLELAAVARDKTEPEASPLPAAFDSLEAPPAPAPYEVPRPQALLHLRARLNAERRVTLCGLAGMGKTTLAAALARDYASSAPVFWLTLTDGVTTSVETLLYQLALFVYSSGYSQVAPLLRSGVDPKTVLTFDQQVTLLGATLTQLTEAQAVPPLLCFDNVHLANEAAMLQVVQHLLAATPAALLLISREEAPLPGLAQVRLTGLEHEEGLALIRQIIKWHSPDSLSPLHIERLLEKTGGNPMLLRLALGQLLNQRDPLDLAAFITHLESEPQVASYLLETIQQRLTPAAWRLLSLIAVFREPVNLYDEVLVELNQAADNPDDWTTAVTELQRHQLIDRPSRVGLHPLVRDYVYTHLTANPTHRRRLHQTAAEWLEQTSGRPVEAAYHYARADQLEAVGEILTDQAEAIINRGRRLAALAIVDETLAKVRRKRGEATTVLIRQLLILRGDLLAGTPRAAEAEADYRQALAGRVPPAVQANIVWRLAQSLAQRGQAAEAVELCRSTAATIPSSDILLLARLAGVEAQALWTLSRYDEAIQVSARVLELADSLADLTPALADNIRAHAYHTLSNVYYFRRAYQAALDHSKQLIETARRAGLRLLEYAGLTTLGALMIEYVGQLDLALFYLEQAEAGFAELGDNYNLGNTLGFKAIAHYLRHEPELAQRTFAQTEKMLRQVGDMEGLATYQTDRGIFLLELGQVAEARVLAERLLTEFKTGHEACWHTMYTLYLLGMVQLVEGDIAAALVTLRRGLAAPFKGIDPSVQAELQSALLVGLITMGDLAGAEQYLDETPLGDVGIWSELNRQLAIGALALAKGDPNAATIAAVLAERADVAGYKVHTLRAARLAAAIQNLPPLAEFPRLLWVMDKP